MARFDWIKKDDPQQRAFLYKAFLSFSTEDMDQKLFSVLIKQLANDIETLELSDRSLDNIIFNVLQRCVDEEDLKRCDTFATYLESSEDERYKKYAEWVKDNILHKEKPEEVVEILNSPETEEGSVSDEEKNDDELSVEEFEKQVTSVNIVKIRELFESGKQVQAKAFIHRMKDNPSRYHAYNLEYLRMKRDLAWKNVGEFRVVKPHAAEELE